MTTQILNGDALLDLLPEDILSGEIIVARECLIDGPLTGNSSEEFWKTRSEFIASEYSEAPEAYYADVVSQFEKISTIEPGSEVNLWFEDDLFCQVNLWYCISLLAPIENLKINLIKPPLLNGLPDWRGFGALDRDALAKAYQERVRLTTEEILLLEQLWRAYKENKPDQLATLATSPTSNFPVLNEVVKAQLDRQAQRPENTLQQIIQENKDADFKTIFKEFSLREGIYGFGDWQVESLLKKIPEYKKE